MTSAKRPLPLVASRPGAPASPERKRFDQLVAKIDKARARLAAWREQLPQLAALRAARSTALIDEANRLRRALAQRLDEMAAEPGWTRTERRTLGELVCELAGGLVEAGLDDEAGSMKALFNRHADLDYDSGTREDLQAMKAMIEAASGVDLGDEEAASAEELMQRARERLGAAAEAEAAAEPPPRRRDRPNAAQARREAEAKAATQSLREVFRKLASALHPDRSSDAADHERRTGLMQRVNQAYAANDLLALLTLQLEIEQIDGEHLAGAPPQRIRHFNKVLGEQLAEIEAEIVDCEVQVCADFGLAPGRPLDPTKLQPLVERERAELKAVVATLEHEIAATRQRDTAKRWLKAQKQALREMAADSWPF
ncbi:MAG: hypothetical protein KGM91_03170 [Burkholderiales bacterium]|nr:hypothetical protein [Burkholderiales bacterium]